MHTIDIIGWRGKRDEARIDPAAISFSAAPSRTTCSGCLFDGQWSSVCHGAAEQAKLRGIHDCDDGFVYVAAEIDHRQMALTIE